MNQENQQNQSDNNTFFTIPPPTTSSTASTETICFNFLDIVEKCIDENDETKEKENIPTETNTSNFEKPEDSV